jgi:hypothetical protein
MSGLPIGQTAPPFFTATYPQPYAQLWTNLWTADNALGRGGRAGQESGHGAEGGPLIGKYGRR